MRTRRGVTLIEMLVAVLLVSIIVLTTAGTMRAGAETRVRLQERQPQLAKLRAALQIIQRDLRCLTYPLEPETPPIGFLDAEAEFLSLEPQSELIFSTTVADPLIAGRPSSGVSMVRYEIGYLTQGEQLFVDPDDPNAEFGLLRYEATYPYQVDEFGMPLFDEPLLLLPGAVEFEVQFYDATTGEWVYDWFETDRLPNAVWVNIGVAEGSSRRQSLSEDPPLRWYSVLSSVMISGYVRGQRGTAAGGGTP